MERKLVQRLRLALRSRLRTASLSPFYTQRNNPNCNLKVGGAEAVTRVMVSWGVSSNRHHSNSGPHP